MLHFTPADGPAGIRTIEAIVQQGQSAAQQAMVAHYRALAAPKPGKARRIKLTRRGTKLTVRWTPHPAGFRTVYARLSDGRRLIAFASAKRHSVSFSHVAKTTTGTTTLTG